MKIKVNNDSHTLYLEGKSQTPDFIALKYILKGGGIIQRPMKKTAEDKCMSVVKMSTVSGHFREGSSRTTSQINNSGNQLNGS